MPLARIILKAQTGIPLNERFTRFMKQRSSEEAALNKQHNEHSSHSQQIRSSDKNRRLALDLEKRHNDLDRHNSQTVHRPVIRDSRRNDDRSARRSRSPPRNRGSNGSVRDRLGNGQNSAKDSSVKDRLGRKSVKDRVELPVQTMADRLGTKPMHERIELDRKPKVIYTNLSPKKFTPRPKTGGFQNGGKKAGFNGNKNGNFRKSGPAPDQETLDKEMDDYMKKSKAGLDSMLDDYMKGAPSKTAKPDAVVAENGAAE